MTDKDLNEREVLARNFPDSDLKSACFIHFEHLEEKSQWINLAFLLDSAT